MSFFEACSVNEAPQGKPLALWFGCPKTEVFGQFI
jgi:hypothetical protein